MQWIKSHLTIVICGAVSLVAIVLIVLGFVLSDVKDVMAQDAGLAQRLRSLTPVNEQMIEQLKRIREDNEQQVQQTMEALAKLGAHVPLHPDVFPSVKPTNQYAPFQFKHAFAEAQRQLLTMLNAKDAPSDDDRLQEERNLEIQRLRAERMSDLGRGVEERPQPGLTPGRQLAGPGPGPGGRDTTRANLSPEELAREDAMVRVSIMRAQAIYCYASEYNLDQRPAVSGVDRPTVEEMWYAQMALWIQQDVIQALASLNKAAAEELQGRGEHPWVGNLPVKHLQRFNVGGYLPPQGATETGRGFGSGGAATEVFTQRGSTDSVDVIHFSLGLVVDARKLPAVIDAICVPGFYTPLLVTFAEEPHNPDLVGYLYGPAPVINVQLDFEGCFLRAKYKEWMPDAVAQAIPLGTAQGTSVGGGGDRGMPSRSRPMRPQMRGGVPDGEI
ncbi:MAG: hypothetical protein GXY55_09105 [Phycisphaerae bacterium]|nr:hypothetical protein [Phycisphaerae bacterium]